MTTDQTTQPVGLEAKIQDLLDKQVFDEVESNLVRLRYGIGLAQPLMPSEIARVMKLKAKALEALILEVDRKIFNHLKNDL